MAGFLKTLFGSKNSAIQDNTDPLTEPALTMARSNTEMQMRTQAAVEMWGLDTASWAVDLDCGTLVFTNEDKGIVVSAPVQVVGTYDTDNGSWLWGWDHPSVSEPLGEYARRVRRFGEQYQQAKLTTRKVTVSEAEAWEFTALACHLGGGEGGYCGSAGSTRVFMAYGTVTISAVDPAAAGQD